MTENTKKMTKKECFAMLLTIEAVASNPELVAFINHEIEQLQKKSGSGKAQSKVQEANEKIKVEIMNRLTNVPQTITEIQSCEELEEYSNQKMNALIRQLITENKAQRVVIKRKSYFALPGEVAERPAEEK